MPIGIVCASDEELAPFLTLIQGSKTTERAMLKFYKGHIDGTEVVALFSGVCRVNAAIASQLLIDLFNVDAIINPGAAGGMDPRLKILDTVISTEICYHDLAPDILTEFHPWMKSRFFKADHRLVEYSKAAIRNIKPSGTVVWGRMATGESFISEDGRQRIWDEFAPLTVDMETAGIAHVCYANSIPFISIRCVTDTAQQGGADTFEKNCQKASVAAADITVALLHEIRDRQNKKQ